MLYTVIIMEIIELFSTPIPFNAEKLAQEKYLPVCLFDELGNYYTLIGDKIYKTNKDILIESVRQIFNSNSKAKFPRAVQSMQKERYKEMERLMKAVPHFKKNRYLMEVSALQKSFIFKQYNEVNFLLKKEITNLEKTHFEYMAAPALKRQTAYGDVNVDKTLEAKYGIGIKKQDGKPLSQNEIQEAEKIVSVVFDFLGISKSLAENSELIISFSHNKSMNSTRNAAGVFIQNYKAIGVSFSDGYGGNMAQAEKVLAHETGHWIDAVLGKDFGCFASSKKGAIAAVLAESVLRSMNKSGSSTAYWRESTECFARAFEEYFAVECLGDSSYFSKPYYCNQNEYKNQIRPLVSLILSSLQNKS